MSWSILGGVALGDATTHRQLGPTDLAGLTIPRLPEDR
jgi:hypothetical protein